MTNLEPSTKNKPAASANYKNVKIPIWVTPRKDGKGLRYSAQIYRSWVSDQTGEWNDTPYLSEEELLRAYYLIPKAIDHIRRLRAEAKNQAPN